MSEDTFSEDIWEYKSKRKPKSVHTNNCSESVPKSVKKSTDGKGQSKPKRKKRTVETKEKVKDPEMCLGETNSQISVVSSQNSSCEDGIPQSQGKETTPRKRSRTSKTKQVSPKIRPVYDGYCPNCQLPFSSLLGQTPRWHVFECLDSPPVSKTECPDGLLCTSTIPSHYRRYTHLLLAHTRAGSGPFPSPSQGSGGSFTEANSGFLCNLEAGWSPYQTQTENLKNVSVDPLLVTQRLKNSQSPTDTKKKISFSTNPQTSQRAPQFTQCVKNDRLVGAALPLAGELDGQHTSVHTHLPLPESEFSSCEISYSPLQSDEETYDTDEKLDDSQPELYFTQSTKGGSLEEGDNSRTLMRNFHRPLLGDQEESSPEAHGILTQDEYNEELYKYTSPNSSSQLFQKRSVIWGHAPAYTDDGFLFPPASAAGLDASSFQATKAKPEEPALHSSPSNKQKQIIEASAVYNQMSPPLLKSKMSKPFESQGGKCLSFHPTQSQIRELSSKHVGAKNTTNSACLCRKAFGGMLDSQVDVLNTGTFSSTPTAAKSLEMLPFSSQCSATDPSTKVMKQMDIGVYFGLPPKRKEEKLMEESAIGGMNFKPLVSPNKKRAGQCKRKAEKSLSDLEFDTKNLNENWQSVELSSPRARHQRKRLRKSDSLQEGRQQKRSDYVINKIKARAGHLSQGQVFIKSAGGRLRRGSPKIPQIAHAEELRKRTCPFYKKIPGTGFAVDAFQYGPVEGCTAYFLTHFHSDHYAGLSKNFTFPVYCSEITSNLLKSKLHVEEQYIHPLPMDTECMVNGIKVVLLDANHCPGAVMILCYLPNGNVTLHPGDFRADPSMERSLLAGRTVHTLYLDTTYCSPEYCFPSQQEVIQFAINTAFEAVTLNPRTLVVCGTYSIGKERVFLAIADVLGSKVGMSREKYKTLQCLNIPEINSFITTDMCNSLIHLLPMMQINFKGLQCHLKMCDGRYDQILAFRPTGWTHSNKLTSMADVVPQTKGRISIYGIPYSEHSSYLEMKRFVQWLKPQKIIPTVNVGTLKSRSTMEKYFKEWKLEAGY